MTTTTKTRYSVTTAVGTFTRTTARTYSHIVVSNGVNWNGKNIETVEWCGRLDLAQKRASSNAAMRLECEADWARARGFARRIVPTGALIYSSVRVFDVATGAEMFAASTGEGN